MKEKFKETSIGENSSKVILEVDGAEVWRTKVIGEGKEPQKDRIVARVNNKEGQPIIYLGMLSKWIPNVFSLPMPPPPLSAPPTPSPILHLQQQRDLERFLFWIDPTHVARQVRSLYPFWQHPPGNKNQDQLRLAIIKPKTKDLEQPKKDEVKRSIKDLRIQALLEFVDSKTTGQKSTLTSTSGIIRQKETVKRPTTMTDKEEAVTKRPCTGLSLQESFGRGGGSIDSKSPHQAIPSQSSFNSSTLGMSGENNTIWGSLSPQLLDQAADIMSLPGIEHLLDEDLFQNSIIQAPGQETIPAITAEFQVYSQSDLVQAGQSSQAERMWTEHDSIVATFPRELHIFSLAEVLANQNIIDFNMERILNKIRVTGILKLYFGTSI